MKKSIGSVFLVFMFLTVLLSGCAPASMPIPPTLTPISPTDTSLPPTATDIPVSPTATDTSLPPTATDTSVPSTATDTSTNSSAGAKHPAAGDWTAVADLGKIVFTVDKTGTKITKVSYQFSNWACGPTSQSGTITVGPAEWPITNSKFLVTTNLDPINNTQTIQFGGTYDAASQKFSGTWKGVSYGTTCSGTWEAVAPK